MVSCMRQMGKLIIFPLDADMHLKIQLKMATIAIFLLTLIFYLYF